MDITEAVVAVFSIAVVVGIPMTALAVRFALKPALETWTKVREVSVRPSVVQAAELEALKLRVAALEAVWEHRLGAGTLEPKGPSQLVG